MHITSTRARTIRCMFCRYKNVRLIYDHWIQLLFGFHIVTNDHRDQTTVFCTDTVLKSVLASITDDVAAHNSTSQPYFTVQLSYSFLYTLLLCKQRDIFTFKRSRNVFLHKTRLFIVYAFFFACIRRNLVVYARAARLSYHTRFNFLRRVRRVYINRGF